MNEEQPTYKKQGCDDEPTSERIMEESSRERDSNQEKKPTKSLLKQWCDLEIDKKIESAVAVVGLLIGIFVAYVALNQLSAMKEQTEAMKAQLTEMQNGGTETKNLIAATEKIAEATKSSIAQNKVTLDATIEANRLEQRAWVGVIEIKHPFTNGPFLKEGVAPIFSAILKNVGTTPAQHITLVAGARIFPKNQPFSAQYEKLPAADTSDTLMFPGQRTILATKPFEAISTPKAINAIKSGEAIVYFFGKIKYSDVFGKRHTTVFCVTLHRDLSGMDSCSVYNEAD